MPEFELTLGADRDLDAIAQYSLRTWGLTRARRYMTALEDHLHALARDEERTQRPLPGREDVRLSRCAHHCVISLFRAEAPLLVVAVLHESMDLPTRLRERLGDGDVPI